MSEQIYGKIFQQMYESSVCEDWQAMITFQQMIVLCDQHGVIDMTPESIQRRTNIPLDIITHGISELEKKDKRSRTSLHDGRRIVLLDEHRDWGWKIVNYELYVLRASQAERNEKRKLDLRTKRAVEKAQQKQQVPKVSNSVPVVPHIDIDVDVDIDKRKTIKKKILQAKKPTELSQQVWDDFLSLRKTKKAPLTKTALSGIMNQAKKAGISLETALKITCERGWQSFKAEWYDGEQHPQGRQYGE